MRGCGAGNGFPTIVTIGRENGALETEKGVVITIVVIVNTVGIGNAKTRKRRMERDGMIPATGRRATRGKDVGEALTGKGKGVWGKHMDTQSLRITISLTLLHLEKDVDKPAYALILIYSDFGLDH